MTSANMKLILLINHLKIFFLFPISLILLPSNLGTIKYLIHEWEIWMFIEYLLGDIRRISLLVSVFNHRQNHVLFFWGEEYAFRVLFSCAFGRTQIYDKIKPALCREECTVCNPEVRGWGPFEMCLSMPPCRCEPEYSYDIFFF